MKKCSLLFLFSFILLFSCEKKTEEPTTDLSGNVILVADDTSFTNHAGILVTIEGTPYGTFTDASGNYSFKGLKSGTKTIAFSFEGFGIYKEEIPLSTVYPNYLNIELPKLPDFFTKHLQVELVTGGYVEISGKFSEQPQNGRIFTEVLYFGKSKTVTSNPNTWVYSPDLLGSSDSTFYFSENISTLLQNGFNAGDSVYIVSYATTNTGEKYYRDNTTQKLVNGCLSDQHSNVVGFKLP